MFGKIKPFRVLTRIGRSLVQFQGAPGLLLRSAFGSGMNLKKWFAPRHAEILSGDQLLNMDLYI